MSTTPQQVEPGQVWRDNDTRTRGAGEFRVIAVYEQTKGRSRGAMVADVIRETGRVHTIRVDRLLAGGARGYTLIGRSK